MSNIKRLIDVEDAGIIAAKANKILQARNPGSKPYIDVQLVYEISQGEYQTNHPVHECVLQALEGYPILDTTVQERLTLRAKDANAGLPVIVEDHDGELPTS